MSLFTCKMCGGTLSIQGGSTVAECEYCGTKQTLPKLDDEKRVNLYDRANHFRRNNEFDKASAIYEQILNEDNTDAEAYWSLVLCRYGIEYVEDPLSHRRLPTVNRAQFTSVFDDDNYKSALEHADMYQRVLYEEEAKAINEIQKGILAISEKEEPFDIFICYKETDANGRRTHDSVIAQELYFLLKQEGFKVFFSRITLEDKLGSAYEPYIFAALNSSKVMVVLGTKEEHFNAVWVKNEWSRYLALIKNGAKKTLIPAYRDMDPYDLPQEFSHLQAQDMSKLGFMQDLIRGIKKILGRTKKPATQESTPIAPGREAPDSTTAPLLRRAYLFLEDGEFDNADEYAEKVLDRDPECAEAYVAKLLVDLRVRSIDQLSLCEDYSYNINYRRALRFGSEELIQSVNRPLESIQERIREEARVMEEPEPQPEEAFSEPATDAEEEERRRHLENVTKQYHRIPTEAQMRERAKELPAIKDLKIMGIVFLILYWPIGLILFAIRANKLNKAVQEENAKYEPIRREYRRLTFSQVKYGYRPTDSQNPDTLRLTIRRKSQAFTFGPDIEVTVGTTAYTVKKDSQLVLPLRRGHYPVQFSINSLLFGTRTASLEIDLQKHTTVLVSWNQLTGELEATIA